MEFTVLKTRIIISPFFFAVLTLFFIADKSGISGFVLLFSVIHELSHFLALLCVKSEPVEIKISVFGIEMELPLNMSVGSKCLVFSAGFLTNFIFAGFMFLINKNIPAYINLLIGFFTALPLASTDGGSILKILIEEFAFEKSERILKICSFSICFVVSFFLFAVSFYSKNYFIVIALIYMIFCTIKTAAG